MKQITPLSALVAIALFSGCATVSYNTVRFDVLRPAVYTLPSWVDTIVIANAAQSPVFKDKSIAPDNKIVVDIAMACQNSMPMQICRNLKNSINSSGYVAAVLHEGLIGADSNGSRTVDSILARHPSAIILALCQLEATTDIEVPEEKYDDEEQCGTMTCATTTRFKLISAPGKENLLDTRHDTLDYIGCGTTLRSIVASMPSIADKYKEIESNSAMRTADLLVPAWQREKRRIYVSNNADMTAAAQWVDQNNWEEARNLWLKVATSSKRLPDRVRAALNTALSYEREDDMQNASLWCSKALDMIETADAKTKSALEQEHHMGEAMFTYLIERMRQKETLDAQM